MTDLDTRIRQQQAAIASIEMMVRFKRCDASELTAAKGELAKLQAQKNNQAQLQEVERTITIVPQKTVIQGKPIPAENTGMVGSNILKEIRVLQNESGELSNQLHTIPEDENCIHFTSQLIEMRRKIEKLWTKYRYLEKNGVMPEEDDDEQNEKSVELLMLQDKRKPLAEERSKLKAKLKQPGNKPSMKQKWQDRLDIVNGIIEDLDVKIRVLR